MQYLALTQPTASWLLANSTYISGLSEDLLAATPGKRVAGTALDLTPLRIAGSEDARLLAIWNRDYATGTGDEPWGILRLSAPYGWLSQESMAREVLERFLYITSQRLQGLLLEGAFIHRTWPNGAQTCLAGRGTDTRQYSLGYFESHAQADSARRRSLICVGPEHDLPRLAEVTVREGAQLSALADLANALTLPSRRIPSPLTGDFERTRTALLHRQQPDTSGLGDITIATERRAATDHFRTLGWSYDDWIRPDSSLSNDQRRILESDALLRHPIRITGPAGSGKTLLMQLLAMRRLILSGHTDEPCRVMYVTHNAEMAHSVRDRLRVLGASEYLDSSPPRLFVTTLSEHSRTVLELSNRAVIDVDAHVTKQFQLDQVTEALRAVLGERTADCDASVLLREVASDDNLLSIFARLVVAEISSVIKGHGLVEDRKRYVESERGLSRLHTMLNQLERSVVFDVFEHYHRRVFEDYEVLDSDDVALSLLGRLRTPIWQLRRRVEGFDFVFVDETQLFNENERRTFPLLTRGGTHHVPIVLALDQAQEFYGQSTAGLATLGIPEIANEALPSSHRSTVAIRNLSFFVIQRSTDLFGSDFPDFTRGAIAAAGTGAVEGTLPQVVRCNEEARDYGRFVLRQLRELRRGGRKQIAVVCHAESMWQGVESALAGADLPIRVLSQRGEEINPEHSIVVLTRPAYVGGQEFDAVVAIGLEQGLVPPRVHNNDALAAALEQQALREMYLAFSRARYELRILLSRDAGPTTVLHEAIVAGLVKGPAN